MNEEVGDLLERERIVHLNKGSAKNMRKLRRVFYKETDDEYWYNGAMSYTFKLCTALHFLGERLIGSGSRLSNQKFGICCSNGQVTPYFLLPHSCPIVKNAFQTEGGLHRHPKPAEKFQACMYILRKSCPST